LQGLAHATIMPLSFQPPAFDRLNAEWAARRLSGAAWKEIADEPFQQDQGEERRE
jgi:hypothetical protein